MVDRCASIKRSSLSLCEGEKGMECDVLSVSLCTVRSDLEKEYFAGLHKLAKKAKKAASKCVG